MSTSRMAAAYVLSLAFSLIYGSIAARRAGARKLLLPLLDVLQSVPILSFLPVVLLSFSAFLPQRVAAELAAIVLIFTSQAWNMTFSYYQSMRTMPTELREAAATFRLGGWLRWRTLDLPFAALGLLWNSMMSWAGGWFFLMASEIFHVGDRDLRLPGLGSYLQTASDRGDVKSIVAGIATLVGVIVLLDQLLWRPLLAWADRFRVDTVEGESAPGSWVRDAIRSSRLLRRLERRLIRPALERLDRRAQRAGAVEPEIPADDDIARRTGIGMRLFLATLAIAALAGTVWAMRIASTVPAATWRELALGLLATAARVAIALTVTVAWTIPFGVWIGTRPRLTAVFQPLLQIVASIPATALFPVLVLILLRVPGGMNLAAVALLLLGTQWYVLFNVVAGASAIPQDLRSVANLFRVQGVDRWRKLVLPALFPFLVTGAITASGGAWNASIVAEYVQFRGETHSTIGVGSLIAQATSAGDSPKLLVGTLALVATVVVINRTVWRPLYRIAERRYRID